MNSAEQTRQNVRDQRAHIREVIDTLESVAELHTKLLRRYRHDAGERGHEDVKQTPEEIRLDISYGITTAMEQLEEIERRNLV